MKQEQTRIRQMARHTQKEGKKQVQKYLVLFPPLEVQLHRNQYLTAKGTNFVISIKYSSLLWVCMVLGRWRWEESGVGMWR
jgi:hypothetical protein